MKIVCGDSSLSRIKNSRGHTSRRHPTVHGQCTHTKARTTSKPGLKGNHERGMKIVCGGNEIHVGANPKQGTKSAKRIPNHYENLNMSRSENSGGHGLPPTAHGQRTHTNAQISYINASLSEKKATRGPSNSYVVGTKCTSEATPNRALRSQIQSQTTTKI